MRDVSPELSSRFKSMALFCSFLVVIIHCVAWFKVEDVWAWLALRDGVCRIAVPFFFFASGFFLAGHVNRSGWWTHALRVRVRTLLVPYLIFNLCFLILKVFAGSQYELSFAGIVNAFGLNVFQHPILLPFWYIRALFILIMMSPLILWSLRWCNKFRGGAVLFLLGLFLLYGVLGPYEGMHGRVVYFFRKFIALQGLFYFSCGMAFRLEFIKLIMDRKFAVGILFCGVVLMSVKIFLHSIGSELYYYFGWLSVPFLMISIFNLTSSCEFLCTKASYSFQIYALHLFVIEAFCAGGRWMGLRIGNFVPVWVLCCCGIIAIIIFSVWLQRRFFPKVCGIIWGGR